MGRLLSALLIGFLVLGSSAVWAEAREVRQIRRESGGGFACGNGKCEAPMEDCAYCPQDCGLCSLCGDGRCTGKETCVRCPKDCGACPEEAEDRCGDAVCGVTEDCGSCPGDCGTCQGGTAGALRRWMARLRRGGYAARRALRQIRGTIVRQYARLELNAEERSAAARQLLAYLDESPDIAAHFTGVDRRLLERVGRTDRATPLNVIPSLRLTYTLKRAARRESQDVVTAARAILEDPVVRSKLGGIRDFSALESAAREGDVETAAALMPQARRSFKALTEELAALQRVFEAEDGLPERSSANLLLPQQASAAQPAGKKSSREAFTEAVLLLQKMRENAADPKAALPSLEERLAYLQERRNLLAGVVNLPENEVADRLESVRKQAGSASPTTLISLLGTVRFIRSSANFQVLEDFVERASARMQSGLGRAFSAVTREAHGESAEAVLERGWERGDAERLLGNDMDARKDALRTFLGRGDRELKEAISRLPDRESREISDALGKWEAELFDPASTVTELREAVHARSLLIRNIREKLSKRRNPAIRFMYALQSFFGIRS